MAKEITREELKLTLRHYWRMRRWAKKQPFDEHADENKMEFSLGEDWHGQYCVLCQSYISLSWDKCTDCPLNIAGQKCIHTDSVWQQLGRAITWPDWITACNKMVSVILNLPREKF